ncbi:hypothetical protein BN988_01633 [Oceanobacillus picturae]|uniref:Uncharacterized protein n=1 Tax=Oceanobacillus picturae TaxID=171693 RepID=W9ACC6_9BACI|nr:hypothetical protein [Oceanobacillus picturae]CDO03133.1 hypothetical protein BN988_01633 [Oceanobacillus picturae]
MTGNDHHHLHLMRKRFEDIKESGFQTLRLGLLKEDLEEVFEIPTKITPDWTARNRPVAKLYLQVNKHLEEAVR